MTDALGRQLPALSSALRPRGLDELAAWGGETVVHGKRVLDVGCGDGRFALAIAPLAARVDGIDPDPDAIAQARKGARRLGARNVRFQAGAAQRLPYRDSTFDVVVLSWSL